MDYQEFLKKVKLVSELSQASRLKETEEAIFQLILSDISDLDKAELCVNLAGIYDRMGDTEGALGWFDKGIAYEQPNSHFEVTEKKAEYLFQMGHNNDSIRVYESLIKQPFVRENEKERMRKTIKSLLGKTMQGWQ